MLSLGISLSPYCGDPPVVVLCRGPALVVSSRKPPVVPWLRDLLRVLHESPPSWIGLGFSRSWFFRDSPVVLLRYSAVVVFRYPPVVGSFRKFSGGVFRHSPVVVFRNPLVAVFLFRNSERLNIR